VVVGDAQVGKSALITQYLTHTYSDTYTATVFETHNAFSTFGPWNISMLLWDVAGSDKYAKKRPVCYPKANVFMICFDLSIPDSFYFAKLKWLEELMTHGYKDHPIIFVGTKQDISLGQQFAILDNNTGDDVATRRYTICECSGKSGEGVSQVFEELTRDFIFDEKKKKSLTKNFKKAVFEKKSKIGNVYDTIF